SSHPSSTVSLRRRSFSSNSPAPPPAPPSFPTRRSSDLASRRRLAVCGSRVGERAPSHWPTTAAALHPSRSRRYGFGPTVPPCTRSEEHTSELQSLTNLVCRLLLEKKNNIQHPQSDPTYI